MKNKGGIELMADDTFQLTLFSPDFYELLIRFVLNLIFLTVIIRFIYYRRTSNKDFLFTYYAIAIVSFMICFALKKLDIDTGMGLGLFAIFGIIRYRTDTVRIREMSYLFVAIGLSVINALSGKQLSLAESLFINIAVILVVMVLEFWWLSKQEAVKTILYEKIENIKPENYQALLADLKARTGLKISKAEVGKIDFLKDTAQIKIYFAPDEMPSAYSTDMEG